MKCFATTVIACVLCIVLTAYLTAQCFQESWAAGEIDVVVSESAVFEKVLAAVDEGDADSAKAIVGTLYDANRGLVSHLVSQLKQGYFVNISRDAIESGERFVRSTHDKGR